MQKASLSHKYPWFHTCTLPEMIQQSCAEQATFEIHNMIYPYLVEQEWPSSLEEPFL